MSRSLPASLGAGPSLLALLLTAAPASAQTDYFWNAPTGGDGPWDTTTANWRTVGSDPHTWLNNGGERANFGGTAGTVTIAGGGITAYGLNFTTTGYTLGGGALTLAGTGGPISVSTGTATYTGVISGGGTVTKIGTGEFRVQGAGTADYTFSKLVVNQGLYRIGGTAGSVETGFGAAPAGPLADAITLDGGVIGSIVGITMNANRGITLGAGGGTIDTTGASMVIPGVISGGGALTSQGAGSQVLTLGGANTYTGATTVSGGTLAISNASALGTAAGGTTVATGAALLVVSDLTVAEPLTLNGTGFNDLGALRKTGAHTATWTGAIAVGNGGAKINAEGGTLVITTGGVSGPGNLLVAGAGNTTIAAPITTINLLSKQGTGTLTLSGINTYTAETTVSGGRVLVNGQSGTNSGTGTGPVTVNGGTLGGTGRVAGAVLVGTGARVEGGDGMAAGQTLTLGNDLVFHTNGGLRVNVRNGTTSSDVTPAGAGLVAVSGSLGRSSTSDVIQIDLSLLDGGYDTTTGTVYTRRLLTYDNLSSLTAGVYASGGPFAVNGIGFDLNPDWQVLVGQGGNRVDVQFSIVPVPEPATVMAVAAAGLGLGGLVRRRLRRDVALAA